MLARFRADSERRDVYNLTVEGAHEFYANGVLVHNCDALRYLLVNLGGGATFYDSPEPARPLGAPELLTPMGQWAVREDPAVTAARAAKDPESRPGAVQLSPFA